MASEKPVKAKQLDDHLVELVCRKKKATFYQTSESALENMLEQAYNWGYEDGQADFIESPDPAIINEMMERVRGR